MTATGLDCSVGKEDAAIREAETCTPGKTRQHYAAIHELAGLKSRVSKFRSVHQGYPYFHQILFQPDGAPTASC